MKKFFTLCFSLLMGCAALNAQVVGGNVDQTVQFTDATGNTIANGTNFTANIVHSESVEIAPGVVVETKTVDSGVQILNTSESAVGVLLKCKVNSVDNGGFQVCLQGSCVPLNLGQETNSSFVILQSGASLPIDLHLNVDDATAAATGEVEVQIMRHNIVMDEYGQPAAGDETYPGSKIILAYTTDQTAGITDATVAESNEVVARYTLDGRAIDAPQKGVNIVKYADGRTVKVVVK